MSALGVPVDISRKASLTKCQFPLGLADALVCKQHPQSAHLKELADSFAHDVLNLAALAGRLLWYEGVTPEVWRSHDLIAVSVDSEAYYVMLQSACDIMADVIATLGAKQGQAPWESFHKLNEWARKNPNRLDPDYRLVAAKFPWFEELNSIRTAFVHRGKTMLVYTDRLTFNCGRLIPGLRDLTRAMLTFSDLLGLVITSEEELQKFPKRKVIDGVYVPALHHLLSQYHTPKRRTRVVKLTAQCLTACGGYVEAAYIGYPKGFWWKVLMSAAIGLSSSVVVATVPVNASGTVHDCKFILSDGDRTYGLVACDHGTTQSRWLESAAASVKQMQSRYGPERVALLVRWIPGGAPDFLPSTRIPVVAGSNLLEMTRKLLTAMRPGSQRL